MAAIEMFFGINHFSAMVAFPMPTWLKGLAAVGAIGGYMSGIPHMGVSIQYKESNRRCEAALLKIFGENGPAFIAELKSLDISKKGLNGLLELLSRYDPEGETIKLEAQLGRLEKEDGKYLPMRLLSQVWESLYPTARLEKVK
jgi:hypothetical protein